MGDNKKMNNGSKILFITQNDPFYIRIFFEEFLKNYKEGESILGVVICPTMGKKSPFRTARQMLDFYGFIDFFRMLFRYFIVTINRNTLEGLFTKQSIPFYKERNVNSPSFIEYWKIKRPDVIVSVAAPVKFNKTLLQFPTWGCINIHHARLPFYKGMMPNFWQMYYGESKLGITVHKMNEKIDEGGIILQKDVLLDGMASLDAVIKHTKRIGAHCIIEVLGRIKKGSVSFLPNLTKERSYFSFPTKEAVQEFRKRGYSLL